MNGLPYYKAYPRDFLDGTIGMPLELKGAYRVLLDLIYMRAGRLPDDARYIAGQLGCSARMWTKLRAQLIERGKISVIDGFISNFRADFELENTAKFKAKQAENASKPSNINEIKKPRLRHTDTDTDTDKKKEKNPPTPRKRGMCDEAFDRFWCAFPPKRRTAKPQAEKKFAAIVAAGEDPEAIIRGAKAYAQSDDVARGFAAMPTTWLNQERWKAEAGDQPRTLDPAMREHDPNDRSSPFHPDHPANPNRIRRAGNDTKGNFRENPSAIALCGRHGPDAVSRVQPTPAQEAQPVLEFEALR